MGEIFFSKEEYWLNLKSVELVSIPSLRRQRKHIPNEMSTYYAKGSSYAQNLINQEKDHFGKEWQETQSISSAKPYFYSLL